MISKIEQRLIITSIVGSVIAAVLSFLLIRWLTEKRREAVPAGTIERQALGGWNGSLDGDWPSPIQPIIR